MSITVVGSVAYDSIETPSGRRDRCLGGAATHFSLAASFFTDVRVIAVVGEDFGTEQEAVFRARNIDISGIERAAGKSFFWEGSYLDDLNEAKTRNTELNVFASFSPKIPDSYRDSQFLFLANIDPVLQRRVREQMPDVKLVAGDTMNYWIKDHRPALLEVLKGLDILLINDTEAKMLAGNNNLVMAARAVMAMGPRFLVVKHGEYGATLFHSNMRQGQGDSSASLPCRSNLWLTPPARAIALPAVSSVTSPPHPNSPQKLSAVLCFTEVSWAHSRWSGSARNGCKRSPGKRSMNDSRSSAS